jgi:cytochrome c oxidase cbb3-type subunit 1
MISGMAISERHVALILTGLAMAVAGRRDPLAMNGYMVLVFSLDLSFVVFSALFSPEPAEGRLCEYCDHPTRIVVVVMFVGTWVAALLAWPELAIVASAWGATVLALTPLGARRSYTVIR